MLQFIPLYIKAMIYYIKLFVEYYSNFDFGF